MPNYCVYTRLVFTGWMMVSTIVNKFRSLLSPYVISISNKLMVFGQWVVLEKLYKVIWGLEGELCSVIMSPTRELADQLRKHNGSSHFIHSLFNKMPYAKFLKITRDFTRVQFVFEGYSFRCQCSG
ncbi:hypothetical protein Hanom_Chr02g00122661 [Helianthus anomalus]